MPDPTDPKTNRLSEQRVDADTQPIKMTTGSLFNNTPDTKPDTQIKSKFMINLRQFFDDELLKNQLDDLKKAKEAIILAPKIFTLHPQAFSKKGNEQRLSDIKKKLSQTVSGQTILDHVDVNNNKITMDKWDIDSGYLGYVMDDPSDTGIRLNAAAQKNVLMGVLVHEETHILQKQIDPDLMATARTDFPPRQAVLFNRYIEADARVNEEIVLRELADKTGNFRPLKAMYQQNGLSEIKAHETHVDAFKHWNATLRDVHQYYDERQILNSFVNATNKTENFMSEQEADIKIADFTKKFTALDTKTPTMNVGYLSSIPDHELLHGDMAKITATTSSPRDWDYPTDEAPPSLLDQATQRYHERNQEKMLPETESKFTPETTPAPDVKTVKPDIDIASKFYSKTKPSTHGGMNHKADKAYGKADILVSIAEGRYGMAVVSAGQQLTLSKKAVEGAAKLTSNIKPVSKALGGLAKRIPVVGAVVTGGYVLYEVGDYALDGDWGKAGVALAAGTAETAGNIVGFGVGDLAREGIRSAAIDWGGNAYEVDKSGMRILGERVNELMKSKNFVAFKIPPMSDAERQLIENDPTFPKTVKYGENEIPLADALEDPVYMKAYKDAIKSAGKTHETDFSEQLKTLDTFEKMQRKRITDTADKAREHVEKHAFDRPEIARDNTSVSFPRMKPLPAIQTP